MFVWKRNSVAAVDCEILDGSDAAVGPADSAVLAAAVADDEADPVKPAGIAKRVTFEAACIAVPSVTPSEHSPLESFSSQARVDFDLWAANQP